MLPSWKNDGVERRGIRLEADIPSIPSILFPMEAHLKAWLVSYLRQEPLLNDNEKHQMMEDLDEYQIMAWEQEKYLQMLNPTP